MATPNTYDELLETAKSLVGVEEMDRHRWDNAWPDGLLASVVVPNEVFLDRAAKLLTQPCRYDFEFSAQCQTSHWDDVLLFRQLLFALKCRSLYRSNNDDLDAAVSSAVAILRLGLVLRNGGIITDLLSGVACTGVGLDLLRRLRRRLDAERCVALAGTLEELLRQFEPFDDILARDQEWERVLPPDEEPRDVELTFGDTFAELASEEDLDESEIEEMREFGTALDEWVKADLASPPEVRHHRFRQIDRRTTGLQHLLIGELAIRAFQLTKKCYPDHLEALVPDYLDAAPIDPFVGEPLRYWRTDDGYLLYSVGDSGEDCGGVFGSWLEVQCCGADLCLDHEDLPEDHFDRTCREIESRTFLGRVRRVVRGMKNVATRPFVYVSARD